MSRDPIIEEMAQSFRSGRILHEDLQHNGISKLTVEYLGRPLIMTWYSGGQPCLRSMTFDGKGHVFDNPDCRYIMKAALDRARNRIYEIVAEINRERASHP